MDVPANPLLTDRGGANARIRVDEGSTSVIETSTATAAAVGGFEVDIMRIDAG